MRPIVTTHLYIVATKSYSHQWLNNSTVHTLWPVATLQLSSFHFLLLLLLHYKTDLSQATGTHNGTLYTATTSPNQYKHVLFSLLIIKLYQQIDSIHFILLLYIYIMVSCYWLDRIVNESKPYKLLAMYATSKITMMLVMKHETNTNL